MSVGQRNRALLRTLNSSTTSPELFTGTFHYSRTMQNHILRISGGTSKGAKQPDCKKVEIQKGKTVEKRVL